MIFICMRILISDYESILNKVITKKFSFVSEVNVNNIRTVGNLFYLTYSISLKDGSFSQMSSDCKKKYRIGDKISFWEIEFCFKKKINIIDLEKDLEIIFREMYKVPKLDIRYTQINYIIN
jgi:hypothetical protein